MTASRLFTALRFFAVALLLDVAVSRADVSSANGLHDLSTETIGGLNTATLTLTDFTITGTVNSIGAALTRYSGIQGSGVANQSPSAGGVTSTFTVSANGTTIGSFELSAIAFEEAFATDAFTNVKVTGNVLGGGTVTSSTASNGSPSSLDTYPVSLTNFLGIQITSFTVTFTDLGVQTQDFALRSFTVLNAQSANTAPTFVGATTTLTVNQDSGATDIKSLLHVSDSDSSQTLTWSQSSAPSHGTLSFSSATASSGSTDVIPGGTITYTPTSGYAGSDSFTAQVSDGTATATRTISVTVNAVASELRFTTQPAGSVSGGGLTTQPVVRATNGSGVVDTSFTGNITLSESSAGALSGTVTVAAVNGVATFTNLAYTATADQQTFTLTTSNGAGLTNATSNTVTSDVVATALAFSTQPAPTGLASGASTTFTTVPVVNAVNGSGIVDTGYATAIVLSVTDPNDGTVDGTVNSLSATGDTDVSTTTVTLTPSSGTATFNGLKLQYTNGGGTTNTIALRATSGALTSATSTSLTVTSDTTPPTVPGVSSSTANGTYKVGDTISIQVSFDENVTVTGTPTLALNSGGTASYASGSGTSTLTFNYTVGAGNSAADLDYAATNALALAGGTIKDAAGNNATLTLPTVGGGSSLGGQKAIVIDGVAPSVSSSSVPANATYAAGQNLDFTVAYAEAVTVNAGGGTPYLTVTLATGGSVQAAYVSGSGTTTLTFRYPIASGNADSDGIAVASSITLNGGTIRDAAGNNAATTGLSFASTGSVLVDGVPPSVSSINRVSAALTNATSIVYTVTFAEAVSGVDTSDFTLTATGTAAGSIASADAINASTYTVTVNSVSGDGTLRLDLKSSGTGITDTPGNGVSGGFTSGQTYTLDHTAPTVSSVSVPANGTYVAGQNLDFTVNLSESVTVNTGDGTPRLAVTLTTGGTVYASYLSGSGTSALVFRYTIQTGNLDGDGIAIGSAVDANGGTLRDAAGNNVTLTLNSVGSTAGVLVDAVAPAAPVITAITIDSGASNTDRITNDNTPVFGGTAEANASVEVFIDGGSLGTTTANGSGEWSYNYAGTPLKDRTYAFTAKATDPAGNLSSDSAAFDVTIDTAAPAAPALTAITNDTGGSSTDQVTSDTTLVLSGTAEANSTVTVSRTGTGVLGTVTADGSGAWSYDYTGTTLSAGDHAFTATASDTAGNVSPVATSFIVTVDVGTPPVPAITAISTDSGANTGDGITNDTTLVLSGTAEANGTVTISRSTVGVLGTATANGTGAWSYDYTATTLDEGDYIFTATTTDAAGNISSASGDFPVTIDTTAPTAPAISGISSDTGSSSSDGTTSDTTPTFSGTAEADSTVEVFRGATSLGTVTTDSNGDWSLTPAAQAEGSYSLTAKATDAAGNTSPASTTFALTVDTTAPVAPAIVAISNDTGSSSSDLITNDPTLVLSGSAEDDSTVTISHAVAGVLGTATADGSGAWTFDYSGTTLADGTHLFTATATDAAGNTGPASTNFVVTVDATAPVITSAVAASGAYKSAFSNYTVVATGSATDFGATNLPAGLSINATTGVISGTPMQSGEFTPTLAATDAAGNTGTAPLALSIAKAGLTVSGVVVGSKPYDGAATATLDFGGASLVGVFSGDDIALVTSGATGTFATVNAGSGIVVTVSGLTLSGADAGHYTLTQPSSIGSITQAAATMALASLNQTYDGAPKSATATTTPAGLSVAFTYDGSPTAPTNAGSYAVVGTINELNYAGTETGTLTIAKADQTVVFANASSATISMPVTLSATASSGLGVTLTLVSGDATLVGTTLTVASATSDVVVQATQAGDSNYNAGSGTLTIPAASITKLSQTIAFAELAGRSTTAEPITLSATATSGLPVSFALVSGPATLSGNTLTLTARTGTIVVTASQAGNAIYDPAPDVTREILVVAVGPQVFFGTSGEGDSVAGNIHQNNSVGAIIGYLARLNTGFVFNFTPGSDGSFSGAATTFEGNEAAQLSVSAMRDAGDSAAAQKTNADTTVTVAAATEGTFTITGTVVDGVITGTIVELGITFTLDMQPQTGPSAEVAGYYTAPTLDTADGHVYSIVGTQNTVYVLAVTSEALVSGTAALDADYTFALTPSAEISLTGALGTDEKTVTGTITIAGETSSFLGTSSTTQRTDRLLNLSSRAPVGATGEQTLIAGFVIGGSEPKTVLLRGAGPALAKLGVGSPLAAPRVRLYDHTGRLLREVARWGGDTTLANTFAAVGAFGYDDDSADAALVATLAPGVYTMHVTGDGATGVALAEIYDASADSEQQRLLNISSRGNVSGGEGILIGGFVVGGNAPKRVLIRGVGPGLAAHGVAAPLANPTLTLYSGSEVIARNDNWENPVVVNDSQTAATAGDIAAAATATGAFALTAGSTDAALIVTLAPGAYTVHVGSGSGTTGIALVEVYEIPQEAR